MCLYDNKFSVFHLSAICFCNRSCCASSRLEHHMLASDKRKLNDFLCLKACFFPPLVLFPLPKIKYSQHSVAVDEDLISFLINDPSTFLTEGAEAGHSEHMRNIEMSGNLFL